MATDGKVNLLLVDDRPDGLLALEVVLRRPEYRLIKASSGPEALRWLMESQEELAVILLDVQMPGMDGFETASLIKMQERHALVPIIFVTGVHGEVRSVTHGYKVGAIDYVTKPFHPSVLQSKVEVLVDLHRKTKLLHEMQEREHRRALEEAKRKLEDEFVARERRLISLVENSTDFIAIADRDSRLIYLNRAGRELSGFQGEEKEGGKPLLTDFFSEADAARLLKEGVPRTLKEGQWEGELTLETAGGKLVPVLSRWFPIRDPKSGDIQAIATITRDITRQKESQKALRESEQRFRKLAGSAPVGIVLTDAQGGCLFVNEQWQRLAGLTSEEASSLGGFGWLRCVHPDDKQAAIRAWQEMLVTGGPFHHQCRFLSPNGEVKWVRWNAIALHDDAGSVVGFICSCVDISENVRNEETLRNAADALTRSNAELQRFAWIASHDLKEPLRMVSCYVTLLQQKYKGKLDPEADQYIEFASSGAKRMFELVEGILKFSGIDQCAQPAKIVDTNAIFDSALSSLQIAVSENEAHVKRGDLPPLVADPVQLGQLFQNLISNALKFRSETAPEIEVSAEPEGEMWVLRVKDNGIGIEPEYFDRIFGIFQRLHTKEQYPGSGVGLAICKKIVEKHGGSIWVESVPGKGSTFCLRFPRGAEAKPEGVPPRGLAARLPEASNAV